MTLTCFAGGLLLPILLLKIRNAPRTKFSEQEYFDNGILMVAMIRAGVELAYETMVEAGIVEESAYYESLHETPLIANLVARKNSMR